MAERFYIRDTVTGEVRWPRDDTLDGAKELARKHVIYERNDAEVRDEQGRVVFRVSRQPPSGASGVVKPSEE